MKLAYRCDRVPHFLRFVIVPPKINTDVLARKFRAEGIDITKIVDPMYFWSPDTQSYQLIDKSTYSDAAFEW